MWSSGKTFYFSDSKMPAAWIPWKSENALWHECNLPLTFSVQCSLICLLPMYFQPHWKCFKVPLDNTHEPKHAELLKDDQNGLQKKPCTWVFKKAWERLLSSRAGLQFQMWWWFPCLDLCVHLEDSFLAGLYFWILQYMQIQTWKYILKGGILIDISSSFLL